jgi:PilZ domain
VKERIRGDRRAKGRFEVVGTLPGTLETWQRHVVRQIGGGGAMLESPVPMPAGSRLTGRLTFLGHSRDIKAEVRYVVEDAKGQQDARYLLGVQWADGAHPIDDLMPLAPAQSRSVPGELERRRWPRTYAADGTEINRPAWVTVRVLDISVSGVLFMAPQPIPMGERGQLRLRLGESSFVGDIEVRRSDRHQAPSGGYRVGANFTALADGSRASLEEFIETAGR